MQEGGLGVGGGEIKGEKEEDSKHSIRFSRQVVIKIVCASLPGFHPDPLVFSGRWFGFG